MRCPKCRTANESGASECVSCGVQFRDASRGQKAEGGEICAWNDHGDRCGYRGVVSTTTTGGGQWYCREHWGRLQGYDPACRGNELPAVTKKSAAVEKWQKDMQEHIGKFRRVA
jgi:hypothetical protein